MPNEIRPIDAVALKNDICGAMQQIEAIAYMGLRNDVSRMSQAINAAIDAAPTLDYAPVSRWISVKERLPEPFKLVIVCRKYDKDFWKVEQGQLTVNGWWKVYGTNLKSVTHWMPLPEPPKEW